MNPLRLTAWLSHVYVSVGKNTGHGYTLTTPASADNLAPKTSVTGQCVFKYYNYLSIGYSCSTKMFPSDLTLDNKK